jgi:hypothetical protein
VSLRLPACAVAATLVLVSCAARQPSPSPAAIRTTVGADSRFEREWTRVEGGPTELRIQLNARPLAFFRLVNRAWTREVCAAFADEFRHLPVARLHGDAHVEQYAVTAGARGLDDFDDSSRGPAVVDLTRFIGSLELAAAQRGWTSSLPGVVDAFFQGYRHALEDPSYMPPDPAVVTRVRAAPVRSASEFLAWADALMEPLSARDLAQLTRSWPQVEGFAMRTNREATPAFLERKAVGWLHLGIGSALTPKLLIRVEGPTPEPDDDLILEAKEIGPFEAGSCVSIPRSSEAARVVEGIRQIGRLPQRLLLALPGLVGTQSNGRGWWVKSWDRTFVEIGVSDLDSALEMRDVAHDVGVQLGSSNLLDPTGALDARQRRRELEAIVRLEPRIRQVAHELATAVTAAWTRGR